MNNPNDSFRFDRHTEYTAGEEGTPPPEYGVLPQVRKSCMRPQLLNTATAPYRASAADDRLKDGIQIRDPGDAEAGIAQPQSSCYRFSF